MFLISRDVTCAALPVASNVQRSMGNIGNFKPPSCLHVYNYVIEFLKNVTTNDRHWHVATLAKESWESAAFSRKNCQCQLCPAIAALCVKTDVRRIPMPYFATFYIFTIISSNTMYSKKDYRFNVWRLAVASSIPGADAGISEVVRGSTRQFIIIETVIRTKFVGIN